MAARTAIAVAGMSWIELVLIARYVHIALVAVPGRGLSVSRSFMARSPSGVAALPNRGCWRPCEQHSSPSAGWSAARPKQPDHEGGAARAPATTPPGRPFGQTHDAEPQCHDADQRQRGLHHGELSHLEALSATALRLSVQPPIMTASTISPSQM